MRQVTLIARCVVGQLEKRRGEEKKKGDSFLRVVGRGRFVALPRLPLAHARTLALWPHHVNTRPRAARAASFPSSNIVF